MNQEATFLQRCMDLGDPETFRVGPGMFWHNEVGSVVVVRDNRKDISPQYAEALSHCFQHKMADLPKGVELVEAVALGEKAQESALSLVKQSFMSSMTEEKFEEFFGERRSEAVGCRPKMAGCQVAIL